MLIPTPKNAPGIMRKFLKKCILPIRVFRSFLEVLEVVTIWLRVFITIARVEQFSGGSFS